MSYYDRLGSVLAREGAENGDTKELEQTENHDSQIESASASKISDLQNTEQLKIGEIGATVGLKKLAIDPLMKAGGYLDRKVGERVMKSTASGTEDGSASFVGKLSTKIQGWAGGKQSAFASGKSARLESAMGDKADLEEKGAQRLASGLDPAGSLGSAGITGARADATLNVASQNRNISQISVRGGRTGQQAVEPHEAFDRTTGLTDAETESMKGIDASMDAIKAEKLGGLAGKIGEGGLDMLPGIGEFAMLGTALGEAIHKAHQIHIEQSNAEKVGTLAGQASIQAGQYVGNTRPSFGSMALPSFDTSHSSSALTQ